MSIWFISISNAFDKLYITGSFDLSSLHKNENPNITDYRSQMRNFPIAVIFKESFQESFQESLSCPFSSACEGHRFQTKFHRLKIPTAKKQKIENTSKVILLILKKQKKFTYIWMQYIWVENGGLLCSCFPFRSAFYSLDINFYVLKVFLVKGKPVQHAS